MGGGGLLRSIANRIVRFVLSKMGGGSPCHFPNSARCCGSPARQAVAFHTKQAKACSEQAVPHTSCANRRRQRLARPAGLVLANGNSGACHAGKCKAGIAVGYGFIFAFDFSRLFAREVE